MLCTRQRAGFVKLFRKKKERKEGGKRKILASDIVDDNGLKETLSCDSYCLVILAKFKIYCMDRILLKPVRCLILLSLLF